MQYTIKLDIKVREEGRHYNIFNISDTYIVCCSLRNCITINKLENNELILVKKFRTSIEMFPRVFVHDNKNMLLSI